MFGRVERLDGLTSQPSDSHQPAYVRCTHCGEQFLRELRNVHHLHSCPTHRTDKKLKWCNSCEKFLDYSSFTSDTTTYDKLSTFCKYCNASQFGLHKWVEWIILQKKAMCESYTIAFDIDQNYLLEQYTKQGGKCFYSKMPLEFGVDSLKQACLECINPDPNVGYTQGNVIIVCEAMRWAKAASADSPFSKLFIDLFNAVKPYVRLEAKIVNENGRLPCRKRTSDAGYDLHASEDAVVAPHTVKSICTGIIVSPPEGTYYTIEGRSSVFAAGVTPYRGIIDGTYQGILYVMLMNNSDKEYAVRVGDRIAQLILHPVLNADFILVNEFAPVENGRADNGWGSSGK